MPRASALLAVALLIPSLAGCLGTDDDAPVEPTALAPGTGIDWTTLTEPVFDALPKLVSYVTSPLDGIALYTEMYLPDGEGPWPTILVNSPYYTHVPLGLDEVFGNVEGRIRDHYVPRGYAVVVADVRGTGNSEGCMDMMGAKEQQDAHDLVEWIAAQPWSDGKVGMYGVSYVGTTPHEALMMAPEHLVTVVTVAGVTNQWRNMYHNGVPYFFRFYPLTYEVSEGAPPPLDVTRGPAWATNTADGACDQEEMVAHVTPPTYQAGIYDDYWAERNFTTRATNAKASIFYSQGFVDRAVNPMEALHWFNDLPVPKKAFFHQAGHQYPPRDDFWDTMHAWFDHWLKGIDNGIMSTPTVEVQTNRDTIRMDTAWPPAGAETVRFHLAPGALSMDAPPDASETYLADNARSGPGMLGTEFARVATGQDLGASPPAPTRLTYTTGPLEADLYMAGVPYMDLVASVDAENTYFLFDLWDVSGTDRVWIAEGWFNAHLREGFDRSTPLEAGEKTTFRFKFEPREYVFEAGHRIELVLRGHHEDVFPFDQPATMNTVFYGATGSALELPVLRDPGDVPPPDGV